MPSGPELSKTRLMILPIDLGRFDFERERDFDDLISSVYPAWVWHCPKRLCPVVRDARKGRVDRFQACEGDIFIRCPKKTPGVLSPRINTRRPV